MDVRVRITSVAHHALVEAASREAPAECCGVIGGRDGSIIAVIPVANVAAESESHFELDPAGLVVARSALRRAGLDVVGFYHSHPRTSPEPSSYDVANAWYPESVYVVIGLEPRPAVRAFRIVDGRCCELELAIEPT